MNYPSVAQAPLPQSYLDAVDALRLCSKGFTPERYFVASQALERCWSDDECRFWPSDVQTVASYLRIASDNTLTRLAARVDHLRREWMQTDVRHNDVKTVEGPLHDQ